ncbi:MAG: hypothetical protein R3330_09650 [Saprospiraceae bacterium]|nr:hypothetical protein [Saprospiraceae bacterium]
MKHDHHIGFGSLLCTVLTMLSLMLSLATLNPLQAQFGEAGPLLTFGIGTGYSAHGDDYQVDEVYRIREYPGFRALIFESRVGWRVNEQTFVHLTGRVSPANTTISPYRYYYAGGGLSQSFGFLGSFYVHGSVGVAKAGIGAGRNAGSGLLTSAGLGFRISAGYFAEVTAVFGKYDADIQLDPNPFDRQETQLQFMMVFSFE